MPFIDFTGRLGRLAFLGRLLGLCAVLVGSALAVAILWAIAGRIAILGMVALAVFGIAATVALHVRRVRDIGWPPRLVVGGWFAFRVVDAVVAHAVPSLRVHGSGTALGLAVSLIAGLVLLFWPGDGREDDDAWTPPMLRPEPEQRYVPTTRQRTLPGEPTRTAPVASGPRGFGRRTA